MAIPSGTSDVSTGKPIPVASLPRDLRTLVEAKPVRVNELDSQYLLVSIPMVQRWTATSSLSSVLRMVGMPTVLTLSITANLVVDAATERVVSQRDEISFAQPPTSADFGSRSSRPRVLPSWVRATLGLPVPLVSTVLGA
ncbi:hypothetical protein HaLaN_08941 [Haematococcus lacustris]|uniref:Uncharacterized protein n=1 Tax=Haematococcus lacustris TaxID=44745 RepID=A0A699YU13_HAELA|nr:hypothetical protein HaLaN_08941 [Haematococcus lacustris]